VLFGTYWFFFVGGADHALVMIKDEGCTSVVQLYRINEDKALLKSGSEVTVTWSDGKIYDATFLLSGKKYVVAKLLPPKCYFHNSICGFHMAKCLYK